MNGMNGINRINEDTIFLYANILIFINVIGSVCCMGIKDFVKKAYSKNEIILFVCICTITPFFEESVFRHTFSMVLTDLGVSDVWRMFITAGIFSWAHAFNYIIHYSILGAIWQCSMTFIGGICLYQMTFYTALWYHCYWNFVSVILAILIKTYILPYFGVDHQPDNELFGYSTIARSESFNTLAKFKHYGWSAGSKYIRLKGKARSLMIEMNEDLHKVSARRNIKPATLSGTCPCCL